MTKELMPFINNIAPTAVVKPWNVRNVKTVALKPSRETKFLAEKDKTARLKAEQPKR